MARHRFVNWNLPEGTPHSSGTGTTHSWESIHTALLMDIRDELTELNNTLNCHRFQAIPATLRRIDNRLQKKIPLRNKRT